MVVDVIVVLVSMVEQQQCIGLMYYIVYYFVGNFCNWFQVNDIVIIYSVKQVM